MRSSRRRSREFVLQGLYQWQLSGETAARIEAQLREAKGFEKTDRDYFGDLLQGTINDAQILESRLTPHLDRPFKELSPVERGILLLAGHELLRRPEIPYKVIINEAVELAKEYGGSDGYKYVNGVLDKLAAQVREAEITIRTAKSAKVRNQS